MFHGLFDIVPKIILQIELLKVYASAVKNGNLGWLAIRIENLMKLNP